MGQLTFSRNDDEGCDENTTKFAYLMSRTNGSTLLHASPVRFLIRCKFLAGVARAAKEIRAAQIFIALIKHLFVTFPELGLWYIICDCICSKRISYA